MIMCEWSSVWCTQKPAYETRSSDCSSYVCASDLVLGLQIYGNIGHSPEAVARVWQLTHGLIKARLNAGVLTGLDATNLDQEDRLRVLSLLPRGVFARYVILDRDLREKEQTRGWRSMDLILQQHKMFRSEERNIKAGDNHPYVTVQDKR